MKKSTQQNLCIDIGNSFTKLALFSGEKLIKIDFAEKFDLQTVQAYVQKNAIHDVIISSVQVLPQRVLSYLRHKAEHIVVMDQSLSLPITINYKSPNTLGHDRIAAVSGARRLYKHSDLLVIGIGTCITYDLLSGKGVYLGGNISPGLDMRLKAMHAFTAKLPLVEKNLKVKLLGIDTTSALQAGALWGMQAEIKQMIEYYRIVYPKMQIVLAGGGAIFFEKRLKISIFAHPNLVVLGLNHILSLNV